MVDGTGKRESVRVPLHCKVQVETIKGTFNGMGRDLSMGGIGVYLKKLPPEGSQVKVVFELPGGCTIGIDGEVAHLGRGGGTLADDWIGVSFMRMDAGSHARIQQYVRAQSESAKTAPAKPPPLPPRKT